MWACHAAADGNRPEKLFASFARAANATCFTCNRRTNPAKLLGITSRIGPHQQRRIAVVAPPAAIASTSASVAHGAVVVRAPVDMHHHLRRTSVR